MSRIRGLLLGLAGIGLLGACQRTSSTASSGMQPAESPLNIAPELLAVPYCPECEMRFPPHRIADTLRYEGKLYGFCSLECKASFAKGRGLVAQ